MSECIVYSDSYGTWFVKEEIVRCRDCVYFIEDQIGEHCTLLEFGTKDMGARFCAWGERRA